MIAIKTKARDRHMRQGMDLHDNIDREPVFIIGSPRSGTTLLRLMMNSHPRIVVPPECGFAVWWYEKYQHWKGGRSQESRGMLIPGISVCH